MSESGLRRIMSRTQGVKPPTRYSHDPHFIAGAKEVLARKPFDYDGRRNDDSQERYENGRLIAIMILQSSLCFLVMLALWVVPALAKR
jgi:hypothetical protein